MLLVLLKGICPLNILISLCFLKGLPLLIVSVLLIRSLIGSIIGLAGSFQWLVVVSWLIALFRACTLIRPRFLCYPKGLSEFLVESSHAMSKRSSLSLSESLEEFKSLQIASMTFCLSFLLLSFLCSCFVYLSFSSHLQDTRKSTCK